MDEHGRTRTNTEVGALDPDLPGSPRRRSRAERYGLKAALQTRKSERYGLKAALRTMKKEQAGMPTTSQHDPHESFQPGDKVRHPKFGEGTIMQRTGSGDRTKFVVAFAEEGEKYLMAAYAKLKRVQPIETKETKEPKEEKAAKDEKPARKAHEETVAVKDKAPAGPEDGEAVGDEEALEEVEEEEEEDED
jgi:hypothetical protein